VTPLEPPGSRPPELDARIASEALRTGRIPALLGGSLLLVSLVLGVYSEGSRRLLLLACAIVGGYQGYCSMRVELDARIFAAWSIRWARGRDPEADMQALDALLARLTRGSGPARDRTLDQRIDASLVWLRRQLSACVAEILIFILSWFASPG